MIDHLSQYISLNSQIDKTQHRNDQLLLQPEASLDRTVHCHPMLPRSLPQALNS